MLYTLQGKYDDAINYFDKSIRTSIILIQQEVQSLVLSDRQRFLESQASNYMMPFSWVLDDNSYENIALLSRLNHQGLLQEIERRQAKLEVSDSSVIKLRDEIKVLTNKISSLRNNLQRINELIGEKRAKERIQSFEGIIISRHLASDKIDSTIHYFQ